MVYNLIVQSEAIVDIQTAFEWYEVQKPGLGYELIEEIENFETLQNPQHYTSVNIRIIRLKVNRFPYIIIYELELENSNIIINAVVHTKKYIG